MEETYIINQNEKMKRRGCDANPVLISRFYRDLLETAYLYFYRSEQAVR